MPITAPVFGHQFKAFAGELFLTWRQQQKQQPLCFWPASSLSACNRSAAGSSWEHGMPVGVVGCNEGPGMWEVTDSCPLWVLSQTAAAAEHWHSRMRTGSHGRWVGLLDVVIKFAVPCIEIFYCSDFQHTQIIFPHIPDPLQYVLYIWWIIITATKLS